MPPPINPPTIFTRRHGLIVSLGLVALVVGIIGSVILLAAAFFGWNHSKRAEPSHVPSPPPTTPAVSAPAPAPPPTVTAQAVPPNTGLPTPGPSVYNQNFISLMTRGGGRCRAASSSAMFKLGARGGLSRFSLSSPGRLPPEGDAGR